MKRYFNTITIILFLAVFLYTPLVHAQSNISGIAKDNFDQKIHQANVLLLNATDSSLVKGVLTDSMGFFLFEKIIPGNYFIQLTHEELNPYQSALFPLLPGMDKELGVIALSKKNLQLEEVKIVVKKPLLEQKIDRLVINVENSITSAGSTALEILERSPGVIIDRQNSLIAMNGKEGVMLMVNGKISHAPIDAITEMLAGMSSGNIEKIELITTPPANLDASGNAGYINIVLKENNNFGTNGAFYLTGGYGKGLLSAAGGNFNHRKDKLNIYGDISYSHKKGPHLINGYTKISNKGLVYEKFVSIDRFDTTTQLNARLGMDYQLNSRTVAGILLNGNKRHFTQAERSKNWSFQNELRDTLITYLNREVNDWVNGGININVNHQFNQTQHLILNIDFGKYKNDQPVHYHASYNAEDEGFLYDLVTQTGKLTDIRFWVAALDYTALIGNKMKLETGFKQTLSGFKNDISFKTLNQNSWMKDEVLSADYSLNENYSAGYVSFNMSVSKKTEVKLGLRYEYTTSTLQTEKIKDLVDQEYGNLFPTLYVSQILNETNKISFSFNSRINRPAFTDLAPFTYQMDANTLITGNPALKPSVSNSIKMDYIFKSYLFSLSYTKEDDAITGFQPETDSITLQTILTPQNLENQKIISAVISLPVQVNNWWTMQFNLAGLSKQVNAIYKTNPVRLRYSSVNIYGSQQFTLPKKYALELSGFYQSKSLSGISTVKGFGSLDFGIRKKFGLKNTFLISATNILNTMRKTTITDLPEQNLVSNRSRQFSQPTFKLTFNHTFGKEKLMGKRERSTGAEEENRRVNK